MLEKISTPILFAILLYHGYHYYQQWALEQSLENYKTMRELPDKQAHAEEFNKPEIIKVTDQIYVAIGYALANSIMIVGKTGVVIIDTTESIEATKEIAKEFRKISDKPIKGVVYTHNHADHVLGTRSFLENTTNLNDVEIWAHYSLMDIYLHSTRAVGRAHFYRAMHQFGTFLSDKQISAAIGFRLEIKNMDADIIPPNKFLYKSRQSIKLGGLELELIHIPGETDDQIAVYWPEEKALFCADDFYKAFPNLYAIRGTPFRSLKLWYESLDKMRNLQAELLVPSHTRPITGAKKIYALLTDYRDAVQLVHDQTVRYMNLGLHPDEIANHIKLPEKLLQQPYLKEMYGTIEWSSKGLFAGYMGWFSGDIVELNPHTPNEQGKRLVRLAGGLDKILQAAEKSLKENDPQWALRLSSAALRYNPQSYKAKDIKSKALFDLAPKQKSMNGYNYYLTCAYSTIGKIEIKPIEVGKKKVIRHATMKNLFYLMSLKFKAEECSHLDHVVLFVFPNTKQRIMFHIRNGIIDLNGVYDRKEDIKVTADSVVWREILSGDRSGLLSAVTSEIIVEPSLTSLRNIMNCFDTD